MKKINLILIMFAVVAIGCLAACEEIDNLLGTATVTVNHNDGETTIADTLDFTSGISDCLMVNASDSTVGDVSLVSISACMDLTKSQAVDFPYMVLQTKDTATGDYAVDTLLRTEILETLRVQDFFAEGQRNNMIIIAESDTSWYVSHSGTIQINAFPTEGNLVRGKLNNIEAYYLTKNTLNNISTLIANQIAATGSCTLDDILPKVFLQGEIKSRRMAITNLITAIRDR